MVAFALKGVPTLGVIIAYADNVLLLAKTKSDVDSMTKALLCCLRGTPCRAAKANPEDIRAWRTGGVLGSSPDPFKEGVRIETTDANKENSNPMECKFALSEPRLSGGGPLEGLHHIKEYI